MRFSPEQVEAAARLVFGTLRAEMPGAPSPFALADLDERLAELEFLIPIPERAHPRLGEALSESSSFKVRRGFLSGSVDLVFKRDGRFYFLDWKSNLLRGPTGEEDYRPVRVAESVKESYELQIVIYTLALLRWLGITDEKSYEARFGGVYYVYLRGAGREGRKPGEGVFFHRASFEEVRGYEEALITRSYGPKKRTSGGEG